MEVIPTHGLTALREMSGTDEDGVQWESSITRARPSEDGKGASCRVYFGMRLGGRFWCDFLAVQKDHAKCDMSEPLWLAFCDILKGHVRTQYLNWLDTPGNVLR